MNLYGKTILLTGASSGIGKALAVQLAEEKCRLVLVARRENFLEELKQSLNLDEKEILAIQCDVSKKEEVALAYKLIKEKFDCVDIAILNAGVGYRVTVENYNSRFAEEIFGANIWGIIYWVELLLPDFVKKKDCAIVGVSSLADNRGYSGSGFYCASKAAASVYLEGLRVELKQYGVKVITVKPGFVKTPMTDKNEFEMLFLMPVEKAANIIINGIKKGKKIIQFPWQMVLLSRLAGFLPGNIYEYFASKAKKN